MIQSVVTEQGSQQKYCVESLVNLMPTVLLATPGRQKQRQLNNNKSILRLNHIAVYLSQEATSPAWQTPVSRIPQTPNLDARPKTLFINKINHVVQVKQYYLL